MNHDYGHGQGLMQNTIPEAEAELQTGGSASAREDNIGDRIYSHPSFSN